MTATTTNSYIGISGRNERFSPFFNGDNPQDINGLDGSDYIFSNDRNDRLYGGLGRDIIQGGGGDDVIYGDQSFNDETTNANQALAAEADAILGSNGFDTIFAGGGNNLVNSGADDDFVWGGSGNELLQGGKGNDTVSGESGNDRLIGGTASGDDQTSFHNANIGTIITNFNGLDDSASDATHGPPAYAFFDLALTDTGSDTLDGGAGNDIIDGQDGADTMIGGEGNDRFYVDNAADVVKEAVGEGADYVLTSVSYGLKANVEVEKLSTTSTGGTAAISLTGNAFGQQIYGNGAGNKLVALGGDDTVYGYGGNDALYGGDGKDMLSGGLGNDQFLFDSGLNASTNVDTITDFENVSGDNDTIRLENAIFTQLTTTGTLAANLFKANATGTATDADDHIVYETDTGKLFYDSNGSAAGGSVLFAVLTGLPALTAADFLVV